MKLATSESGGFVHAVAEVFGGDIKAWFLKLFVGGLAAIAHAVELTSLPFIITCAMLLLDSILGAMLAIKKGGWSAFKPWLMVKGPTMKLAVGTICMGIVGLLDVYVLKTQPGSMMSILYVVAGIIMSAVSIDAVRKVDEMWNVGIAKALASKFPGLFGPKDN